MVLETPTESRPLSATCQRHRRVSRVLRPKVKIVTAVSTWAILAAVLQPNRQARTHLQTVESAQIAQVDRAGLDSHHPLLDHPALDRLIMDILSRKRHDNTKTCHALPDPLRNPKSQCSNLSSKAVHRHRGNGIQRAIKCKRVRIPVITVGQQIQKVWESVAILPFDQQTNEKPTVQKV